MSSPEPYQSRLLNFLNRQGIKWRDSLEVSARKIKTVANWSLQLLLYPVYFLVQTGRLAGHKLVYSQGNNFKLPSSTIIESVLGSLDEPSILGIACNLEDRQLVLTKDQEIIPVSPQDNQPLKQRIYLELVEYYRQARLKKYLDKPLTKLLPKSPNLLPPVRLFWQTLAWVEGGKLATSLNLFNETRLVTSQSLQVSLYVNYSSKALLELIQAALDYFLSSDRQSTRFPQPSKLYLESKNYLKRLNNSLNSDADPFQIKYIIYAALEHFFLQKGQVKRTLLPVASDEAWLSWEELFPIDSLPKEEVVSPVISLPAWEETVIIQASESLVSKPSSLNLEYLTDCLETEAKDLGYVEHSLEKSIKWLDRLILWVEESLLRLWRWLRRK